MGKTEKEEQKKVDLQEIQAALERDRADLASKILSKLPSTSASSSSSSSTFSNPTSASKSTSTSIADSNFIHRPANLGLGAPLPKQAAAASNHSLQENRLKGRLIKGRYDPQNNSDNSALLNGKSRRDQVEEKEEEQEVEEDSRAAIIKKKSQSSNSTSNTKSNPNSNSNSIPNSKGKNKEEIKDPFSLPPPPISKKERKRQAKEALEESSFDGGDSTVKSFDGEDTLQGLTKSQRKKLKKKMKLTKEKEADETEVQAEGSTSVEMKTGETGAHELNGKDEEGEESGQGKGNLLRKEKGKRKEIENPFALPGSSSKNPQSNSTSSKIQLLSPAHQQARDVGIINGTHQSEPAQEPEEEEDSDPSSSSSKAQILSASSSRTSLPTFQTSSSSTLTSSLSGAQFRTLNESLYTLPSSQAVEMVKNEPSLMEAYHQGFRDQTKKWPSKPVEIIAEKLREAQLETMVSSNERDEKKKAKEKEKDKDHPNPQHHPNLAASFKRMSEMKSQRKGRYAANPLIVDLGCGEAPLARLLTRPSKKSLDSKSTPLILPPLKVLSYDLLPSQDGWVQAADVASEFGVPLPGKNVGIREKILIALSGNHSATENDGPATSMNGIQETKKKKRKRGNLLISTSNSIPSGSTDSSNHHESKAPLTGVDGETMHDSGAVCDVVVFCLCLMGTNWIQMIREGRRILQTGGELIIAEVTSRMTSTDDFIEIIESLGFQLGEKDLNSNTHFQLYSFIKLSPFEILSRNSRDNPSLVSEVRSLVDGHDRNSASTASNSKAAKKLRKMDETKEKEMVEKRGAVLKPCLYKRR